MVEIKNVKVYELEESVIACRNAMRIDLPEYTKEEFETSLPRAISLCKSESNSGHCNFLSGILVAYDIIYPNYFSPELQRYHFNQIVTSSSKMHRLGAIVKNDSFNKYVDRNVLDIVEQYAKDFESNPSYENRMKLLSNCPLGIELFMRCSTNYLSLRNIYHQRKNHRLKEDWGAFCKFIEDLPYFNEFILGQEQ